MLASLDFPTPNKNVPIFTLFRVDGISTGHSILHCNKLHQNVLPSNASLTISPLLHCTVNKHFNYLTLDLAIKHLIKLLRKLFVCMRRALF